MRIDEFGDVLGKRVPESVKGAPSSDREKRLGRKRKQRC